MVYHGLIGFYRKIEPILEVFNIGSRKNGQHVTGRMGLVNHLSSSWIEPVRIDQFYFGVSFLHRPQWSLSLVNFGAWGMVYSIGFAIFNSSRSEKVWTRQLCWLRSLWFTWSLAGWVSCGFVGGSNKYSRESGWAIVGHRKWPGQIYRSMGSVKGLPLRFWSWRGLRQAELKLAKISDLGFPYSWLILNPPAPKVLGRDLPDGTRKRLQVYLGGGAFFGQNLLFLIGRDARLQKTL